MTPPSSAPAPGDPVVLLAEQRSPRTGRVFEIGERARVVSCDETRVQLIVADATSTETLTCPRSVVAHGVPGTRRPATPSYRRRDRAA
jgi:hypothetical protein